MDGHEICIDDEIPFEIPESWEFVRIKNIFELLSGRDLQPSEYNDSKIGIPYMTGASNFHEGQLEINRWTTVPKVISKYGDLLFTCKGTVGEIAFNGIGEIHIARQIMALRNHFDIDMGFISMCLGYFTGFIKNKAKGLIPGILREDILNCIIPIPPLIEQQDIIEANNKYSCLLATIESRLV